MDVTSKLILKMADLPGFKIEGIKGGLLIFSAEGIGPYQYFGNVEEQVFAAAVFLLSTSQAREIILEQSKRRIE